jgi:hypothetical protein
MTEDEAKTKWCPAYRVAMAGAGGSSMSTVSFRDLTNRPREGGKCMASACMVWRVSGHSPEYTDVQNTAIGQKPKPVEGKVWRRVHRDDEAANDWQWRLYATEGHCGLAGRP